jgi:hypothetical protein
MNSEINYLEFLYLLIIYIKMQTVEEIVEKKRPVKDMRTEIKELKKDLFVNTAVMRADKLSQYLDKLRYASNLINAEDAMGGNEKKFLKEEHKELDEKKKHKKSVVDTEAESDESSSDEEEKPKKEKKVKKEVEMVKKDMKKEMVKPSKEKTSKLHKDEMKHLKELEKHLESIPKPMHSAYKKHLKMADGDHEKARKMLKKEMKL